MVKKIQAPIEMLPAELDSLYAEFLKHFYDEGNHAAAATVGARLTRIAGRIAGIR